MGHIMVNSGHTLLPRYSFAPPVRTPDVGIEVVALSDVMSRGVDLTAPHRIDFHQLLVLWRGHTVHVVDFTSFEIGTHDVLWARPGQVQQFCLLRENSTSVSGWLILFTDSFVGGFTETAALLTGVGSPTVYRAEASATVPSTFEAIVREFGDGRVEIVRHLLAAVLLMLNSAVVADIRTIDHGIYEDFLELVETHYTRVQSISAYAAALGCSARSLARGTRAHADLSPKQIVNRRRILEAKRLLAHTNLPVATVARRIGIDDVSNFGKLFARYEHTTPAEFRRRQHLVRSESH